jgi:virulence factor Mce-like protein
VRRLIGLLVGLALIVSGWSVAGGQTRRAETITVEFSRAVQIFPGNSVRVLGVRVGRVTDVQVTADVAEVEIRIDDPDIELPADVKATLVPESLLGERYVQLFPAYEGGPTFTGDRIPLADTSVPAEQDELLRGLQDYFGAIDPDSVSEFVTNAASILEGNGEDLNRLIEEGSSVLSTLARKKDNLAGLITELNQLTLTLSTRQESIARLIGTYNVVVGTLTDNRAALEGTVQGLNAAMTELASLLTEHRNPLAADVKSLTRTFTTLARNAESFARTGKWANKLFEAASRAVDYERNWLRLGNQGGPLASMILFRLQDRLKGVCLRLGVAECSTMRFWAQELPGLFCVVPGTCPNNDRRTPGRQLDDALEELPDEVAEGIADELGKRKNCKKAKNPKKCRKKKRQSEGNALDELIDDLLDGIGDTTGGVTEGLGGIGGGD